jgi:DNA-binding XRE family transcriptional regulator
MSKNIHYLQFRAARNALNLGVREVAQLLKVSKATVNKADLGKTRDFFFKHSPALISFFEKKNIFFPNEYSIRYGYPENRIESAFLVTRFQLKCARSILNISQLELANLIKVNKNVISRAELIPNSDFINFLNVDTNLNLKNLFSKHQIEFPDPFSIFFKKYIDK